MREKILFLTDLNNGDKEDIVTIEYLKSKFDITVSYFNGIEQIENDFDLIIIRNTWPSDESKFSEYNKLKKDFLKRAKEKKLKIYNDINACADRFGKDYLVSLFSNGYPVIPSIDTLIDLDKLPEIDKYIIKPKYGFSSFGIKTIDHFDLQDLKLIDQIIQPKLRFVYEISFYFIDRKLIYCLIFKPHKSSSQLEISIHNPNQKEINLAIQFIEWNKMKYGISRIDFLKLQNGDLLLLEIEDDSPYFSLKDVNGELKNKFLVEFTNSVSNYINSN